MPAQTPNFILNTPEPGTQQQLQLQRQKTDTSTDTSTAQTTQPHSEVADSHTRAAHREGLGDLPQLRQFLCGA